MTLRGFDLLDGINYTSRVDASDLHGGRAAAKLADADLAIKIVASCSKGRFGEVL